MTGAKVECTVKGTDKVVQKFMQMKNSLRGDLLRKSIMEGGALAKRNLEAAAPQAKSQPKRRKWGPLFQNIIIYERRRRDIFIQAEQDNALAILVGPNKQAFYGYFLEKGYMHIARTSKMKRVRDASGRRKVIHTGGRKMPALKWIENAAKDTIPAVKKLITGFVEKGLGG